jgi:uncharacterized protein (TIGR02680 family)
MTVSLPEPGLDRWQPLRAGLVDLFYYDSEEFWFRDGRLLLRGNNGTGKSKALALMLPFLLDGELAPHRVEPDADPKKKMEWNLLLGGAHPYPERLGYTWLEFGRQDGQRGPQFCTVGCGLKAVSGKGIARHWFFVTSRRIGPELALVDATGTALTRDRLIDALAERGSVYDKARDYRRAVDERLFGFGEQRYNALVSLLIQLRQPQLSKRPSEKALSDALTEALPPLDQAVVADAAEAFRSLEEDRDALAAMTEARDAAASFLTQYRRYARVAARRRAAVPRNAQATYERLNRDLADADAALADAEAKLIAARARQSELDTERRRLQARDEALRASPEMRSARELERAYEDARRLRSELGRVVSDRNDAARRVAGYRTRNEQAAARRMEADGQLASARAATTEAAGLAGIAPDHAERVDQALDVQPAPDITALRRGAAQLAERQRLAIAHVRKLIDAVTEAARRLATARIRVDELDAEAAGLAQRRADADLAVREQGAELIADVHRHLAGAVELRLPDPATVLAELELWVDTVDGANPAAAAVTAAGQVAAGRLARSDAELAGLEQVASARLDELTAEIGRLERGVDGTPPAPYTRAPTGREGRPGAPLWRLVDFSDDVTDADRAGVEAALEAAGVLDAWVTPDGELLAPDLNDVLLRPADPVPANLGEVLRPAVDREDEYAAAVADATVVRLLAGIGFGADGPTGTWVAADGRFRIGVLAGAWQKPVAAYIGRGAREAARRARLTELRAELSTVDAERTGYAEARRVLTGRMAVLAAEVADLPRDDRLRRAHAVVATLVTERERLAKRQADAGLAVAAAIAAVEGTRAVLEEGAGDAGLPSDEAELSAVAAGLASYREALAALWPAVGTRADAVRQAREAADDLNEADTALGHLAERAAEAELAATAAAERHDTLRATVGAAVADLQRQLAEVASLARDNESAHTAAARAAESAIGARGSAGGRREQLAAQVEQATTDRAAAAESFRRFAGTGLLAVALPELDASDPAAPWAPDPTVRLARRVNDDLAEVADDDTTWDRAQHRLNGELKTLQDTLARHGNKATADLREDGVVVEVEFQGRRASVPEVSEGLTAEVADRERLLSEREREILENHLVNEVASTLQELISAAEAQVAAMNEELSVRPTSTGMRLRLVWQAREDGPAGLAAARERLLRQTSDAWSEQDRTAVGEFLQARIAEVRARDVAGTWLEHLTEALDYRGWSKFVIQRHQNGQWRSATGPASGGERVLAASVPLFAAASSHYASAGNRHAPRLVTLDEAFAGVDDNARAKYLGLLAAFDLDVVMTSEREWGCYPEVPGLAISQLSRTDDVAAVLVTNWEWDGRARTRAGRPIRPVTGYPSSSDRDGPAQDLVVQQQLSVERQPE